MEEEDHTVSRAKDQPGGQVERMGEHPAVANLREHQRQLDADGCEVGVSRQALDETLALLERAHRSLRALQEGAAAAFISLGKGANGTAGDFLAAIHREAVRGLVASDDVTNEAPSHQQPHDQIREGEGR